MDISLVILIGLTAAYAGGVAVVVRPSRALMAAGGVIAVFALMLGLAYVWYPGSVAVAALFAGGVTWLTLARDLGRPGNALVSVAAGLLIGASFLFVSYLAVMALIGAAGVYLVLRRWLRPRTAMLAMGGALGGMLAASAAVFAVALANM
ncbi:hypothetical protein [Dactylosporangium sp. CA-233914]|uniref:hypothetical protein n=1 Tax=Dactylosporangium sp. CA-233914 TaxID=3239934 RepID=UPI003D90874A